MLQRTSHEVCFVVSMCWKLSKLGIRKLLSLPIRAFCTEGMLCVIFHSSYSITLIVIM